MIIALINNKGGVAKTTTAVNLSAALAGSGRRVLLVDLDSQGAASLSLGLAREELRPSSANVLFENRPAREIIRQTSVENLDLITGSMELGDADLVLSNVIGREQRLKNALAQVRADYDFILIDCPPSLSLLSVNALLAADQYIVPLVPHFLALGGLASLLEAIDRMREENGSVAELMGLALTMVDYRNRVTEQLIRQLRENLQEKVFQSEVRVSVRLTEAPAFGKTIFQYAPSSSGARYYYALAQEVALNAGLELPEYAPARPRPATAPISAEVVESESSAPAGDSSSQASAVNDVQLKVG